MVTVLATGYKGVITSLLCNVPLGGELLHYESAKDVSERLPGVCFLNYPEEGLLDWYARSGEAKNYKKPQHFDCLDKSGNLRVRGGTHTIIVYRPSCDKAASLKDELFRSGFVETDAIFSPVITGPQIRSSSPYFKSINKLLGRVFEAGLFEHAERIAKFKSRVRREFKYERPSETGDVALELSDLRPCFVIWVVRVVFSLLTFAVSHVIARFRSPHIRMTRHTVLQT
ncbi:uncharacterized protein LOC120840916 [Ixodes scapularis]|uniref:uncharacterized protein LOC120840916 n=1 Tax=Ixodes scapularis TaxID=6945 RepID=UPI001A9EF2C7|nr:uncharacterized protein LOC120840916 [Ixodes scapularis]